ncbi:MAG: hypothetical protein JWN76_958 [Chitinophagaceae bacterium]|nr:hypothetical protein [Chitinophagaceae bacterium]
MEQRTEISNELNDISPAVAALSRITPFSVPDDYFNMLADHLMMMIHETEPAFSRETPFSIPAGYFDNLAAEILNKLASPANEVWEELEELAPILNTISKENVYTVPPGYFQGFDVTVPGEIKPAKIFQLKPFPKKSKWFRYAAAALITGVIGTTIYVNAGNDESSATLPNRNIHTAEFQQSLSAVSTSDIANYLSKEGDDLEMAAAATENDNGIQAVIQTINDKDIKEYLKENTEPGEKNLKEI